MATFTITTAANFDAQASKAGGDTYNINGGTLTIDGDTRYDANCTATTGSPAVITISATLGGTLNIDGSGVYLIPYTGASGNAPAAGTTVTQGGVTAKLLGFWSAINVAPTAVAAAVPAAGYVKVKQVTGGAFAAGAVTISGITGLTSSGAQIQGWIDVCADESGTLTISRLGKLQVRGAWFSLGTANGSAGQVLPLPTSGQLNFWVPGVWIETGNGTNAYEFWPSLTVDAGGGWTTANQSTDARSKFVQCDGYEIRIGSDGVNNIGYVPANGARIRIPNVFLQQNTAARGTAAKPNATIATRFETAVTGSGVIDLQYANCCWYLNMAQPYSVDMVNVAVADAVVVSECAAAVNWNGGGTGITNPLNTPGLSLTSCFAGGKFQNLAIGRAGTIGSGSHSASMANCIGQIFNNVDFYQGTLRTNNTLGFAMNASQCANLTFTGCTFYPAIQLSTCTNCTLTNSITIDRMVSTTLTTFPTSSFTLNTKCSNITISGLTFGGFTDVQPYNSLISITACDNIKVRNIGTAASLLSLGVTNPSRYIFQLGSNNTNLEFKRIYTANAATASGTYLNDTTGVVLENVWGDAGDKIMGSGTLDAPLNCVWKGCYGESGTPLAAFTAVYGTHFWDTFTAATTGRNGIIMNEPTTSTASQVVATGTSKFTSAGSVYMPNANDTVTWTWPHYILGNTGFSILNPTVTGGTTVGDRLWFQYQIDKNDGAGFGATHNLRYPRAGGSGTTGQFTFTVTNATGVEVGDYAFGTNVGASARVTQINSNTITVNVANAGTVSGVIYFCHLPFETSISATLGYKLKVVATVITTDATNNTLTGIYWQTITDATSQQTQYPLDLSTITLTGLQNPTEVRVFNTNTTTLIAKNDNVTSGTFSTTIDIATYPTVDVSILALGYQNTRLTGLAVGSGFSIPVQQQIDRQYFNPPGP